MVPSFAKPAKLGQPVSPMCRQGTLKMGQNHSNFCVGFTTSSARSPFFAHHSFHLAIF